MATIHTNNWIYMGVQLICELMRALLVLEKGPYPEGPVSAPAVTLDTGVG